MTLDYFYGQSGELFSYHEPVGQERLDGQAGTGVYHLHCPGSAGIALLRRTQGGQTVPRAGTNRSDRTQAARSGQTQPDLRQRLHHRVVKNAQSELRKQQFRR